MGVFSGNSKSWSSPLRVDVVLALERMSFSMSLLGRLRFCGVEGFNGATVGGGPLTAFTNFWLSLLTAEPDSCLWVCHIVGIDPMKSSSLRVSLDWSLS